MSFIALAHKLNCVAPDGTTACARMRGMPCECHIKIMRNRRDLIASSCRSLNTLPFI